MCKAYLQPYTLCHSYVCSFQQRKRVPPIWVVVLDGVVVLSLLIETGINFILLRRVSQDYGALSAAVVVP